MLPSPEICERARLSRDPRFDGWFYVGVLTTGIYCRPVCPARPPHAANVRFYASAAAAQEAGFRPCLRCRPERGATLPEWGVRSPVVVRALRLIERGVLDEGDGERLAARVGVSERHLNRLFHEALGATAKQVAQARRRHLAKRLIDETNLPLGALALQAGYASVRRFNDDLRGVYGRTPSELRHSARNGRAAATASIAGRISLRLAVRAPYAAASVFEFLGRRALAGFEVVDVDGKSYRRRVLRQGADDVWITVEWDGAALKVGIPDGAAVGLGDLLYRVRRVFDVDADPCAIDGQLAADPLLAHLIATRGGGLRVPGAWSGYETAVRAVLGQQVSVAAGRRLAERLLERFGDRALTDPAVLAAADPVECGMPARRFAALRALAGAVRAGDVDLHAGAEPAQLARSLCALPGIGPWTAGYIAMRVLRDPDAFPVDDWVVKQRVGETSAALRRRAESWRPWRAYAVMYLWRG
jgi:AraC family transcriptional regulator of adaptative response / DNA-3-methyladenine glycosylase II